MYFKSRQEAGKLLADQLAQKYAKKKCAVIALSDGGVIIGAEIAMRLRCVLTMLLTSSIVLPRENDALAAVNQEGNITFNELYSTGELEEMEGEYRTVIEQQRLQSVHDMNSLLGESGLIRRNLLENHVVILASDGLNSGMSLDAAVDYLKPVKTEKLVIATPLASVPAVDRMHILTDEIFCLNVLSDYISTDHYYATKDVPDHTAVVKMVQDVVWHWK